MRLFALLLTVFSIVGVSAQLDAYLDGKYFNTPNGPIYETYIEIYASTVKYVPNEVGERKCEIEVVQMLKSEDSIVSFYKEVLTNAELDSNELFENLMTVKRFAVENNQAYTLEVVINDLNDPITEAQSVSREVLPHFASLNLDFSDIVFLSSFSETKEENVLSKSGYDMLPLLTDFFEPEFEKIAYYFEVYNSDKVFPENKLMIKHYIENAKTGQIAGKFVKQRVYVSSPVIPVLHYFDIQQLPSGSYNLVAEVRDEMNELIGEKRISFTRLNLLASMENENLKDVDYAGTFVEDLPEDSLDEFIYCLYPIVSDQENRIIDKNISSYSDTMKRQFIYSFWYNMNPEQPLRPWLEYKEQVKLAEQMFGTPVKRGYQTDRGRIFLKYGAPNTVTDRPNEPSSYPYQLWHYYKIGKFNNKRFVFYQPDLVTNDYELLHSDLQGEIQNFKWQKVLQTRNAQSGNIDDANEGNYQHWGGNTNVLFNNP